jgi:DNA-binding beta-propeller fold protein YncE
MRHRFARALFRTACTAAAAALVIGPAGAADASGEYAVTRRIVLGGAGKWDYTALDASRHRLYVTRGDHVEVVDVDAARVVGRIPTAARLHGVAFAPDLKRGFTANGQDNTVTVFDLDTLAVQGQYKVDGKGPDTILYDAASHDLLVFNGHSNGLAVIDARDGMAVRTVALPGKPEFAAIVGTTAYVNLEDTNSLAAVDFAGGKVLSVWKLPDCQGPTGLDFDATAKRIFSVCDNGRLVVTDPATGHTVANLAVGKGPDAAIYDAARHRIFVSAGDDGTLSVIAQQDADHYSVAQTLTTAKDARTMAMDPTSGRVFLPTPAQGAFTVIVASPAR